MICCLSLFQSLQQADMEWELVGSVQRRFTYTSSGEDPLNSQEFVPVPRRETVGESMSMDKESVDRNMRVSSNLTGSRKIQHFTDSCV